MVPPGFWQVVQRRLDLLMGIYNTSLWTGTLKIHNYCYKITSLHSREAAVALILDVGDADGERITVVVAEAAIVLRVGKLLRSLKVEGD